MILVPIDKTNNHTFLSNRILIGSVLGNSSDLRKSLLFTVNLGSKSSLLGEEISMGNQPRTSLVFKPSMFDDIFHSATQVKDQQNIRR